jgi:hypothetical protein
MHRPNTIAFAFAATLAVGCTDNARTETTEPGEVTGPIDDYEIDPGSGKQTLDVGYDLTQPSCDAALLAFEVFDVFRADGTRVTSPQCRFEFDDGGVSTACTGEHIFAEGGFHDLVVTVVDPETKEFFTEMTRRNVMPPIEAFIEARQVECELAIEATVGHNVTAFSIASVSPEENVVGDAFRHGQGVHTFEVTQPGIYVVTYFVEDERAIPICTETISQKVEVKDCNVPPPCDPHDAAH